VGVWGICGGLWKISLILSNMEDKHHKLFIFLERRRLSGGASSLMMSIFRSPHGEGEGRWEVEMNEEVEVQIGGV